MRRITSHKAGTKYRYLAAGRITDTIPTNMFATIIRFPTVRLLSRRKIRREHMSMFSACRKRRLKTGSI